MKKFCIFAAALVAAFTFTSCEEKPNGPDLNALPNGFYVSEAGVDLIEENAMDQGINEVDQTARTGMYEKYIVLEAGKKYEFVNKKGAEADKYGATLEYGETLIVTDNTEVPGYKGSLAENATVEVTETGLYHIVLDFNEDGNLSDVGGAQCIIVPVVWGVRGAMNGWGFTAGEKAADSYKWEWNCTIETAGAFKFAHSNAWKINLDIANLVKANTNLGADCLPGGADIPLERAEYKITLEFVGPAATTQESYKCTVEKTGELPVLDPSTFVYSFIGTVNGNWDTDTDFAFVSKDGEHYVFEAKNLDLAAGEFKIRFGHDWAKNFGYGSMTIKGIDVADNGGNIVTSAAFKGSAKFEFDWDGSAEKNVVLTFTAAE